MKKKIILLIVILLISLLPNKLYALGAKLESFGKSNRTATIGKDYTLELEFSFDGIENVNSEYGIGIVNFTLGYDKEIFILKEIKLPDGFIYLRDDNPGKLKLAAAVDDENHKGNCHNGNLYCGNFKAYITFYIQETTKKESTMGLDRITAYIIKGEDYTPDIEEEDLIKVESDNVIGFISQIKLEKEKFIKPTPTPEPKKSSNTNLKSLEIQNYPIDFNKETKEYEITVGKNINK